MWTTFFASVASASATLAGLIFVGVSISLARILSVPTPARSCVSVADAAPVRAGDVTPQLVPGQPARVAGAEFLGMGLIAWLMATGLDWRMLRHSEASYRGKFLMNAAFSQLAVLPLPRGRDCRFPARSVGLLLDCSRVSFLVCQSHARRLGSPRRDSSVGLRSRLPTRRRRA